MSKSHYDVIGVAPTASADQIRKAYLNKARRLHPDQFVDRPTAERDKAERGMKNLNAAWAVLSDVEARRAYDIELGRSVNRGTGPITSGRARGWEPFDPGRPPVPPRPKPGPKVADERDMEIRGPAKLLRPLPLLAMVGTLVGLIVLATLITGGGSDGADVVDRTEPEVEPTGVPLACLELVTLQTVPCGNHDAIVWSVVDGDDSCPEDLEAVYRSGIGGLYCITRTP